MWLVIILSCIKPCHPPIFLPVHNECYSSKWLVDGSLHQAVCGSLCPCVIVYATKHVHANIYKYAWTIILACFQLSLTWDTCRLHSIYHLAAMHLSLLWILILMNYNIIICPIVGRRPQHAVSTSAYLELFSARWYPSSTGVVILTVLYTIHHTNTICHSKKWYKIFEYSWNKNTILCAKCIVCKVHTHNIYSNYPYVYYINLGRVKLIVDG